MITISLDEYGKFEEEVNQPLFIAGLIFDDGEQPGSSRTEEKTERTRITAYYKRVMEDVEGAVYPVDLHSDGDKERDHSIISSVKKKVEETLPEFICKGTYKGVPLCDDNKNRIRGRKGKYHLFVLLKSDAGKKHLLAENANMLVKDDWAANRYFHMASSVVNRLIFHNPLYSGGQMPAIKLDIATRATGDIDKMGNGIKEEFQKQKYKVKKGNNREYYSIMNADIYRTLIAQEMVNSGKINIRIEKLNIKSICYDSSGQGMEFLYLADSICSILGYRLTTTGSSADDWLVQIKERICDLNRDNENLIFGYDEIDNYFSNAWGQFENKDMFKALSVIYDAKGMKGEFAKHYQNEWFPFLEEQLRRRATPELFLQSVDQLHVFLQTNNIDQEKLLYIMQQLESMVEGVSNRFKSKESKERALYKLYDAGVAVYCHIGDASKAQGYYEKCRLHAVYVSLDDYMKTNNRLIVLLEDAFQWNEALNKAKENLDILQMMSELKREALSQGNEQISLDEAITISQYARVLAEKRDAEAENYFKDALSKITEGSANYKITQSYLLHHYADMGEKGKFDEESKEYFDGKNTYNQRFKYIVKMDESSHSVFSKKYALYVLIRGLLYFYKDEISNDLWKELCVLDETLLDKDGKKPGGHPWELIYKYLEILAIERKDKEARNKFRDLKKQCLTERGATIEALEQYGEAEVADCEKNYERRDRITEELSQFMRDKFEAVKDAEFSEDGNLRFEELQKYFTFMYR